MSRQARTVIPNVAHHVTQRGNNRQDVFFTTHDRQAYLEMLRERCQAGGVTVLGYCLMKNHVHLIVVPPDADALAHAIGRTHFAYTQYINRLHGRSGHLWQGRFYSCPLDDVHEWRALAYIERNPVRARLVRRAWRWPWSSAAAHVGGADSAGLLDVKAWRAKWTAARWRKQLLEPADEAWRVRFWRAAGTGRPLAEDRWLARLEAKLGRRLRANPVGRPPKVVGSSPAARRSSAKLVRGRSGRPVGRRAAKAVRRKSETAVRQTSGREVRRTSVGRVRRTSGKRVRTMSGRPVRKAARKSARHRSRRRLR